MFITKLSASPSTVELFPPDSANLAGQWREWGPGEIIEGLYRIDSVLATGGMGILYKALDLATNRQVVIKSLRPKMADNENFVRRFVREAEEWVQLGSHPHIVRAFTVHEIEWNPRIVAEFIDGPDLFDFLEDGPLSLEKACRIAVQICWGMAHAHDMGLAHRDLKPGNILISKDGVAKVTDFGLVKRMDSQQPTTTFIEDSFDDSEEFEEARSVSKLQTIGVMGTPEYIAPEQWDKEGGKPADIYAFGILFYEMLCGRRPFEFPDLKGREQIKEYRKAHCSATVPELQKFRQDLPQPIADLILSCLKKDPKDRPRGFRVVANKLNALAKVLTGASFGEEPDAETLDRDGILDQAYAYLRLANGTMRQGDYLQTQELLDRAHSSFEEIHDNKGLASCFRNFGSLASLQCDYERGLALMSRAIQYSKDANDIQNLVRCYNVKGVILRCLSRNEKALKIYKQSIRILKKLGDETLMSVSYNNVGTILQDLDRFDEAIKVHRKSLKLRKVSNDQVGMSYSYNNIGYCLAKKGEFKKAISFVQQSIKIRESLNDQWGLAFSYNHLCEALIGLKKFQEAIEYLKKAKAISETVGDPAGICRACRNLGRVYFIQKKFKLAEKMFFQSLKIGKPIHSQKTAAENYFDLGLMYSEQDKTSKAIDCLEKSLLIMERIHHPNRQSVQKNLTDLKNK